MRKMTAPPSYLRHAAARKIARSRRKKMNQTPKFGIIRHETPIIASAGLPFRKITDKAIVVTTEAGQLVSL